MAQILLRRLLMMLVILFLLSVITFILMHTSDSDPVKLYMIRSGIIPTPELIAEVRALRTRRADLGAVFRMAA
ncbi:hypothetical protein [Selenomonas sp. CM52]|uniref:hypothetical protein n=1 Tax=Selenomonas sp. CM52 TaxID=936381 RepID=UPI00027C3C7C|nr:hypothetical protein [Selenomonas sp. CM52]EJU28634.1 hypothetical protein HMPREF1153_2305 [Selenomonas sp. CM52]